MRLREPPYGTFFLTFDKQTAVEVAGLMTGTAADGEFRDLHESALQEICNIMTSGFVDGIANTLGTTIDFGTSAMTRGTGQAIRRRCTEPRHRGLAFYRPRLGR